MSTLQPDTKADIEKAVQGIYKATVEGRKNEVPVLSDSLGGVAGGNETSPSDDPKDQVFNIQMIAEKSPSAKAKSSLQNPSSPLDPPMSDEQKDPLAPSSDASGPENKK